MCITSLVYTTTCSTVRIDPLGYRTSFAYDSSSRVIGVTAADGTVTSFSYTAAGTTVTDPRGGLWTMGYQGQLPVLADRPAGEPDVGGVVVGADDVAFGRARDLDADLLHGVRRHDAGVGGAAAGRPHDADVQRIGQVSSVTGPLGGVTTILWDELGNRIGLIDALGNQTTYVYNAQGLLSAQVDALGDQASMLYDAFGRLTASVDPLGNRTSYAYDVNGQLLQVTDPLGNISTTLYDNMNRLVGGSIPWGTGPATHTT